MRRGLFGSCVDQRFCSRTSPQHYGVSLLLYMDSDELC